MQTITPFLWFDHQAEEAMNFYVSVFKDAKPGRVMRRGDGAVVSTTFELNGQQFMALNGGPHFTFSPAISFFVTCESQAEVDHLWEKLPEGGETQRCGWLKDKFGVSWQIVPSILGKLLHESDAGTSARVMQAMMAMNKLDIAGLQRAADGN